MTITPRDPFSSASIGRRKLLAMGGGAIAAGAFGGLGGFGRAGAAGRPATRRPRSGDLPKLSQWYHEYGEEGVREAVERYAAAYPDAEVSVEWVPGDYDNSLLPAALLTDDGPDVFEVGNGPNIDMIQSGQVLPLGDILGDAADDFNAPMISRLTYDGQLWAVPQVIDMQFLAFRPSLLEEAGVAPPTTLDELIAAAAALTTGDRKGLFVGNDGGVGVLGGPSLWAAGADYLTADNQFGFDNDAVYASLAKVAELYASDSLLLGAPTDWSDPGALINELTAMQWTGLWTLPALMEAFGDDIDVVGWPALDASTGAPSAPIGAYASAVSAKTADPEAAKAFIKWLWVDQTDYQSDFALGYGFHIPSRNSLADAAEPLQSGAAANAVKLSQDYGHAQSMLLWAPAAATAFSDALSRIITEGADPASEIAGVKEIAEEELERIGAGSGSAGSAAPTEVTASTSA